MFGSKKIKKMSIHDLYRKSARTNYLFFEFVDLILNENNINYDFLVRIGEHEDVLRDSFEIMVRNLTNSVEVKSDCKIVKKYFNERIKNCYIYFLQKVINNINNVIKIENSRISFVTTNKRNCMELITRINILNNDIKNVRIEYY